MKSAVIIGGGLGGLFTGAILSKEGFEVTILEKNSTIGGGLQTFRRFGEVFDTGMHIIGGMQKGGNIRKICQYLGILDKVEIRDVDDNCTDEIYFDEDKTTYRIAKGKDSFVESLACSFPEEKDNLIKYVNAIYSLADETDLFNLRPSESYLCWFQSILSSCGSESIFCLFTCQYEKTSMLMSQRLCQSQWSPGNLTTEMEGNKKLCVGELFQD
jgi:phytoene dehydrogenase-like protein